MKQICYERTEFGVDNQTVTNDLVIFIYDVPYLGACGIFPPVHILNSIFKSGGGDGGTGPGAIWTPFEISDEEYKGLISAIENTPAEIIRPLARYGDIPFEVDPAFDHIADRLDWITATCKKHREAHLLKIQFAQASK